MGTTSRSAGLRAWAAGMLPLEAAVELLIGALGGQLLHGPWVRCGEGDYAWFDPDIAATEVGVLSGGERRVLDIVCSLVSSDHPVDLGDAITGLDPKVLRRVLRALAHAGGHPTPDRARAGAAREQKAT